MIKNYLKITIRNIARSKVFSSINICGLALGMACSLLILLWVQDERSVDGFHKNGKRLYQVYERNYYDGKIDAGYPTQGLLAEELKKVIPEIELATGFENAGPIGTLNTFEAGDKINKAAGLYAGADFFKMFSYPLLAGDPQTALNAPGSIAISRKMAETFYGSPQKAIGQLIRFENTDELKVSAVFENIPVNSSQQFDFLRTWQDFVKHNEWVNNWGNTDPASFIQLHKNADAGRVEGALEPRAARLLGVAPEHRDGTL